MSGAPPADLGVVLAVLVVGALVLGALVGAFAARALGRRDVRRPPSRERADDDADPSAGLVPAAALIEAERRLAAATAARKELLDGVSHELRTPLARLEFALELIELAEDERERVRRIEEARADVAELASLVRELLAHAALEGPGARTARVAPTAAEPLLRQLAEEAGRLRAGLAVEARLALDLGTVPLEPSLARRMLGNVLSNAARYARGRVVLGAERRSGRFVVTVDDDGPGIPPHDRARVFDPFVRLDAARARDTGGTGLGLSIALAAARAHGGTLIVEDGPLGGARFVFALPAEDPSA